MRTYTGISLGLHLAGAAAFLFAGSVWAAEKPPVYYERRDETEFRYGNDRALNLTQTWWPLEQRPDRVTYVSVRTAVDNRETFEGNLGLGRRQFYGDYIWGGYGFIDRRRTRLGSDFWQMTTGVEYYRATHDWRFNLYVPFNATRYYTTAPNPNPILTGNGVFIRGPGQVIEEARPGGDIELGFHLPDLGDFLTSTRVFGAVYHFVGDQTPNISGVRARVQADATSWMQVGARAQYDDERGGQFFAELVLRWPGRKENPNYSPLWQRMSDAPERDIDIVVDDQELPGVAEPLRDRDNGDQAVRILYVDQSSAAGGDGSAERPYRSLDDALATATAHDTIYVASTDTTPYGGGYTLNTSDLTVHGAGSALYLNGDRYHAGDYCWSGDLLVRAAAAPPVFTNAGGDTFTVAAQNITLRGLDIEGGAGHGVLMETGADHLTLENMRITGQGQSGLTIYQNGGADMNVRVRDTVIAGNLNYGIQADDLGGGTIHLDAGQEGDAGLNDIYGNIGGDVYISNPGGTYLARGNYWGNAPRVVGGGAGGAETNVAAQAAFYDVGQIAAAPFADGWGVTAGVPYQTNTVTLGDFRGSRYVGATAMDGQGPGTWVVDGISTAPYTRVHGGQTLAVSVTPATFSYGTRFLWLYGGGLDQQLQVQTQ